MPEPDAPRRSSDRTVPAGSSLQLREVVSQCATQRANAERQRDGARSMREEARAMRDRSRVGWPRGR